MSGPLVSCIIPTFNRCGLLPRAVESILAQSYRPMELVIVNDGSTDQTQSLEPVLQQQAMAAGVDWVFFTKENGGLSRARNDGVAQSHGAYFGFCDDDDRWASTRVEKQVAELLVSNADACCCRLTVNTATGPAAFPPHSTELLRGLDPARFISGERFAHINSLLVARALWEQVGEFDPELKLSQDVEWQARLVHIATFCAVDAELGTWDFEPGQAFRVKKGADLLRRDEFFELVLRKMKERNATRPGWNESIWRQRVAREFDEFVKHRLYAGQLREARACFERGVALAGMTSPLSRTRGKMRKAWWLSLIGKRLRHPKFQSFEEIRS